MFYPRARPPACFVWPFTTQGRSTLTAIRVLFSQQLVVLNELFLYTTRKSQFGKIQSNILFSAFSCYFSAGGMNGSIVYELARPENAGLNKPVKVFPLPDVNRRASCRDFALPHASITFELIVTSYIVQICLIGSVFDRY